MARASVEATLRTVPTPRVQTGRGEPRPHSLTASQARALGSRAKLAERCVQLKRKLPK